MVRVSSRYLKITIYEAGLLLSISALLSTSKSETQATTSSLPMVTHPLRYVSCKYWTENGHGDETGMGMGDEDEGTYNWNFHLQGQNDWIGSHTFFSPPVLKNIWDFFFGLELMWCVFA
jgi:hypothetical protein